MKNITRVGDVAYLGVQLALFIEVYRLRRLKIRSTYFILFLILGQLPDAVENSPIARKKLRIFFKKKNQKTKKIYLTKRSLQKSFLLNFTFHKERCANTD